MEQLYDLFARSIDLKHVSLLFHLQQSHIKELAIPLIRRNNLRRLTVCSCACRRLLRYFADLDEKFSVAEAMKVQSSVEIVSATIKMPSPIFFDALATIRSVKELYLVVTNGSDCTVPLIDCHAFYSIAKLSNLTSLSLGKTIGFFPVKYSVSCRDWMQLFQRLPSLV
ncbi:hypothetical protein K470DRAFT_103630 [Piedraia hortae CBS 480.64]|uniref:F-box domain-containing protein n=1 Tax=Piedraia hortae CBS 480.64 TaxID=1314780 RepID=A0A6A7CA82_9PEZI|nr:hypothetical protein K470DRAFT_103630 [Piedraia hortae CBS 480.64]